MKKEKETKTPFKIDGLMDKPRWYALKCSGKFDCIHCKFKRQENMLPRKSFQTLGKTCNRIKINRGKQDEVIGWFNILG
jgi:hypothetical protein